MILSETKYTEDDYQKLVLELMQCADIDAELQHYPKAILSLNPSFYLKLFRTVSLFRQTDTFTGNKRAMTVLNSFEQKLLEYTNILPADLPDSILKDQIFISIYLADHRNVFFLEKEWLEFKDGIEEKANSIPQSKRQIFLEWCLNMLKLNLARHNKKCQDPDNCVTNKGYDRRLQFILKLIEDAKPQPSEPLFVAIPQPETMSKSTNKIQWLGTQKELAELFVELKRKGWIEKFENQTIQNCFTESKSVPHYLKPGTDTKTGENDFDNLYNGYIPKFFGIRENPKHHK